MKEITLGGAGLKSVQNAFGVLPIWGIQRERELDEWLSYMENTPVLLKKNLADYRKVIAGEVSIY